MLLLWVIIEVSNYCQKVLLHGKKHSGHVKIVPSS